MDEKTKALKLIFTWLMNPSTATNELQWAVEQVALNYETQTLFERLELLFSRQEHPEWLEAVAAYKEGLVTPEMTDFLDNPEAWGNFSSDKAARLDALVALDQADRQPVLPAFPDFAEQFRAKQNAPLQPQMEDADEIPWNREDGFKWKLRKAGEIIIRFAQKSTSSPLIPVALMGSAPMRQIAQSLYAILP